MKSRPDLQNIEDTVDGAEGSRDIEVRLLVMPRHRYVVFTTSGRKLIKVQTTTENTAFIQKLRVKGRKWTQPEWVTREWLEKNGCRMVDPIGDRDLMAAALRVDAGVL